MAHWDGPMRPDRRSASPRSSMERIEQDIRLTQGRGRMMNRGLRIFSLMGGISLIASASAAMAQDNSEQQESPPIASDVQDEQSNNGDEIVVIGSQIKGADVAGNLPVTVSNEQNIDAIAATSGDDLFRAIPQAGDVAFNERQRKSTRQNSSHQC